MQQSLWEGAFAVVLVIVLAVPFVVHLQRLRNYRVLVNYSGLNDQDDVSSSSLLIDLPLMRNTQVSQIKSLSNAVSKQDIDPLPKPMAILSTTEVRPSPMTSCVDALNFNYRAHRHQLLEEVLKKYYSDCQPPGEVVMNSIHLNAFDGSEPKAYDRDIFDFVGKLYNTFEMVKSQEYMHPFDHFLLKGSKPTPTEDKTVATKSSSLWSITDTVSDILLNSTKNIGDSIPHMKAQAYRHLRQAGTAESSSDQSSSIFEGFNDGGSRLAGKRDEGKQKQSPLVLPQPEPYSRKPIKGLSDTPLKRSQVKSNVLRSPSPTNVCCEIPMKTGSPVHGQDALQKVATLDSSKPTPKRIMKQPFFDWKKKPCGKASVNSVTNDRKIPKKCGEALHDNTMNSVPGNQLENTCSAMRLKLSRLPVHVNSRKPVSPWTTKELKSEYVNSIYSIDSTITIPSKTNRPKTSIGTVRSLSRNTYGADERSSFMSRVKRNGPRPRTVGSRETKCLMNSEDNIEKKNTCIINKPPNMIKEHQDITSSTLNEVVMEDHSNICRKYSKLQVIRQKNDTIKNAIDQGLKCYIEKLKVQLIQLCQNSPGSAQFNIHDLSSSNALMEEIEESFNNDEMCQIPNIIKMSSRENSSSLTNTRQSRQQEFARLQQLQRFRVAQRHQQQQHRLREQVYYPHSDVSHRSLNYGRQTRLLQTRRHCCPS